MGSVLLEADLTHGSLYDLVHDALGLRPTAGSERIALVVPSGPDLTPLQLPRGEAAFRTERLVADADTVLEWRCSLIRGDRYRFVARWP